MAGDDNAIQRGFGTQVSPVAHDLLKTDSRPVPPTLSSVGNYMPKSKTVPFTRYHDRAFAELEREKLWKKVWQIACREEDIPEVGDRVEYKVSTLSYMIVRSGPNEFRAFHNNCRHRGTRLCDGFGAGDTVRCPFHGWEWHLDGRLKNIPSRWDFEQVKDQDYGLTEVKVGTWAGFIFIHPDRDAGPLSDALGVLPEHFKSWPPEDHYTAVHVRKHLRANWKLTLEAFLESYHVIETHSEALGFTGDASTTYDIWEDGKSHVSRLITPSGVPSPHLGDDAPLMTTGELTYAAFAMAMPGIPVPKYDPSSKLNLRAQVAEWRRQTLGGALARDLSGLSDAAMIDSIQYWMFPNFCPWWGEGLPLVYQFLPDGDDPERCIMDVRLLLPKPGGGAPTPPAAKLRHIAPHERFGDSPELGILSIIFDQDAGNLERLQAGVKAAEAGKDFATLGRYQECRIQHFHEVLEKQLGLT
ncbi:MAG TPA: aromatic ring-hydroxylating dioxygenase subunit alpha [Nevskiaceae bacterium]|nr:aromatic ring-hydroxylating dioxygenase subunit alpha [Nevskiaceae bacterium]